MANINPKLNLNKTPYLVENNSLVFAKNIRLDVDGTIHRDYGVFPMSITRKTSVDTYKYYKALLDRIIADVKEEYESDPEHGEVGAWLMVQYLRLLYISGQTFESGIQKGTHKIVGIIPDSNAFYIFIHGQYQNSADENDITEQDFIIKYDEKEDKFSVCNCNWHWSGGDLNGCVLKNLISETLLNVGEVGGTELVPFKSINLNTSTVNDDESIYTQVPNIPLTNLTFNGKFACVIPNGVYQFFVRYKIRQDFYTDWFPASSDIFVGNSNNVVTSYGTLAYTNTHRDSDNSFVLNVEHICSQYEGQYESFQVGFLLSHDDAQFARAWKHFGFGVSTINFDYKATDAIEIEPTDLTKTTYGLYNVGNVTSFKNKLYISNYTETAFNQADLQTYADNVRIELATQSGGDTYDGNPIITAKVGGNDVISGLIIDGVNRPFTGSDGLFHEICNTITSSNYISIEQAIKNACSSDETTANNVNGNADNLHWLRIIGNIDRLSYAKSKLNSTYKNTDNTYYKISYTFAFNSYSVSKITVNGVTKSSSTDILNAIYNTSRYLNEDCQWINSSGQLSNKIEIKIYRPVTVICTTRSYSGGGSNGSFSGTWTASTNTFNTTYSQDITITFVAWKSRYSKENGATLTDNTTLVPYQKYKFYVHYVKSNGEITNGLECKGAGELTAPYMATCNSVIYPIFSNIQIPKGYVACFFSISHTKINAATIFNIKDAPNSSNKESSCVDINMMLMPGNKNINIRQTVTGLIIKEPSAGTGDDDDSDDIVPQISTSLPTIDRDLIIQNGLIVTPIDPLDSPNIYGETEIETNRGQYYYSSDASTPRYFGADGVVVFPGDVFNENNLAYSITDYSVSETENIELVKCTPYLNGQNLKNKTFDDFTTMNLLGYICNVSMLDRERCAKYYTDGSSVYHKTNSDYTDGGYSLYLKELSKYNDAASEDKLSNFSLLSTNNVLIYSNYNLNYVTLSEEPKMAIKTYYNRSANSTGSATESEENNSSTILLRLVPSQLMSDVYTLPPMYKTYLRKTYSSYSDNEITEFNNTVRSSILYGDENRINILAFDANDYYNIPTNRGRIVNLVAVGDSILVHTEDSMFKFTGSNSLQSSDGEIQPAETQPFNTGVAEMFGSDFGFAGLQNKTDSIITEQGYIFFDRDSRIVYMYSGQGQIVKLSDSIEKLFRHRDIANIYFANDFYNNRVFLSILFYEEYKDNNEVKLKYYPVTLSFSTLEQVKSFVSLHDFYYHKAFNTKTNCYFLTADVQDICTIDKVHKGCYTKLANIQDKIYPLKSGNDKISVNTGDRLALYNLYAFDSIIDIIDNTNFENVKTLDAISWYSNIIDSEYKNIDTSDEATLRMAEDINSDIPCKYLRIYTDTCMTPLNDFTKVSNNYSTMSANSYKYPRYNQGFWTFNYFRNILNSNGHKTKYVSDENSLIEGKYFVVRFVFDREFKLETLSLNYKGKI